MMTAVVAGALVSACRTASGDAGGDGREPSHVDRVQQAHSEKLNTLEFVNGSGVLRTYTDNNKIAHGAGRGQRRGRPHRRLGKWRA